MKTLPEFLALPLEQQFDYLWNNCQRLALREEEDGFLVGLYYGGNLLVEVWFDHQWNVVRILPFTGYRSGKTPLENRLAESFSDGVA